MTDNNNNNNNNDSAPASPTSPGGHQRRASVGLSPFWAAADLFVGADMNINQDDEAIASPKVHERGIIDFPMEEIAFFPLPTDECASDERALLPEKRLSRRLSTSRAAAAKVPTVVAAVESEAAPVVVEAAVARGGDAPGKSLVDIEGTMATNLVVGDKSIATISSDTSVASSSNSVRSEFSENTAGSKCRALLFIIVIVFLFEWRCGVFGVC